MADQQGLGAKGLRSQVSGVWGSMSPVARIGAILAVVVVAGALVWTVVSGSKTDFVPVARGLSPEDEAAAVAALDEKKIPYELDDGGSILVPAERLHEARLELAVTASPGGTIVGFEIFDESELGRSAFNEKVNYHRALEGELSRTIRALQPVEKARVHLVMPERRLFESDQAEPSASVVLQIRPGQILTARQVLAVRNLVAAAVERLSPEKVAVVDQHGSMLARPEGETGNAEGLFENQMAFERGMERRVIELLEPLVGVGNVKAQVSARLDFSRVVETTEKFDPDGAVVRSERLREEKSTTGENVASGAAGTSSNVPGAPGTTSTKQVGTGSERSDRVVNYEIDRKTQKRETPHARVERLSVSVVVNGVEARPEGGGESVYTPRPAEEMKRYEDIVRNAVGFDVERGDQLAVTNARFVRTEELEPEEEAVEEGLTSNPLVRWGLIGLGVLLVALIAFLALRSRKRTTAVTSLDLKSREDAAALELAAAEARMAEETSRFMDSQIMGEPTISDKVQLLRQRAIDQARADVRRTASVIRGWLGQEISG